MYTRPALALLLLPCLFAACANEAGSHAARGPRPVFVEIMTVEPEPIQDIARMVGALAASESVMIRPETDGVVEVIAFEEGQNVEQGDLLIKLRDDQERARLAEAEAQLALADNEFERARTLAGRQTVSKSELDRARAVRAVAVARRDRRQAELAEKEVLAPFDGVLSDRLVSPGDRVGRDSSLVQIDAIEELRLIFTLPEIAVSLVHLGDPVEVSVVPYPDESFPGEVYFVAPTVNPTNRRLLVKAIVPNPGRKLRPGLFANIDAEIASRAAAIVVPESAVAYDAQGPFVWRVGENDLAERVSVTLGIRGRGKIEITEGIEAGERIVGTGTHKVIPGSLLRPADTADTKDAPAA